MDHDGEGWGFKKNTQGPGSLWNTTIMYLVSSRWFDRPTRVLFSLNGSIDGLGTGWWLAPPPPFPPGNLLLSLSDLIGATKELRCLNTDVMNLNFLLYLVVFFGGGEDFRTGERTGVLVDEGCRNCKLISPWKSVYKSLGLSPSSFCKSLQQVTNQKRVQSHGRLEYRPQQAVATTPSTSACNS